MNRIKDDQEYEQTLKRIVKGAEYLENPFIKPEDYKKGVKLYDELYRIARAYRTNVSDLSITDGSREEKTDQGSAADHLDQTGT